jgi:hypothetical protein
VEIYLPQGLVSVVDDEDFDRQLAYWWSDGEGVSACVSRVSWASHVVGKTRYVTSRIGFGLSGRVILLHRLLLECPPDKIVDHRNRDGLDNRRSNLRIATKSTNMMNSARRKSSTGFRGVKSMDRGDFMCQCGFNGRKIYGGRHATAEDAARAYDRLAIDLHGEFAVLNFPLEAKAR